MDFSKNQSSKTQTQSQKAIEQAAKTAQKSSHKVELDHLHAMSVTGVEDVPTFTDKTVVIRLKGETLTVSGQNLAVKNLDVTEGKLQIEGQVNALKYSAQTSAKAQAICFALCFAAGIVAGVFALLCTKKAGFFERALLDLFATGVIGAIFICCIEFFMQGLPSFYGVLAYVSGTATLPLIVKKIRKIKREKAYKTLIKVRKSSRQSSEKKDE